MLIKQTYETKNRNTMPPKLFDIDEIQDKLEAESGRNISKQEARDMVKSGWKVVF